MYTFQKRHDSLQPSIRTRTLLGLLSGFVVAGLYAVAAVCVSSVQAVATELSFRPVGLADPAGWWVVRLLFTIAEIFPVMTSLSMIAVALPAMALASLTGFLFGSVEKVLAGRLSVGATALLELAVSVAIGILFEIAITVKMAHRGPGDEFIVLPWSEFAELWQGALIYLYVVVNIVVSWKLHGIYLAKQTG